MDNRVIKDIRHYELKPDGYTGKFDGILGNVYKGSFEVTCIGQRISRKLNEFQFISGDFDHVYIYLTDKLPDGKIVERDFEYDKQVKCFNVGQNVNEFNSLNNGQRETRICELTFQVLHWKFGQDENNKELIDSVEELVRREGRKVVINYKDKETEDYKVSIGFQIAPIDNESKLVIDYLAKKDNRHLRTTLTLDHYEDIYFLVDKISIDNQRIVFLPKKTPKSELVTKKYATPLSIDIKALEPIGA